MQKNHLRRHPPAGTLPSPRLSRSRSKNPDMSPSKIRPNMTKSSTSLVRNSTSKTNNKDEDKPNHISVASPRTVENKNYRERRDGMNLVNPLQGGQCAYNTDRVGRRIRSTPNSPSAWALSPGRALPASQLVLKSPSANYGKTKLELGSGGRGGRISGFLEFFRQKKKMSRVQEEEFHQFRILQNRLLQWRFVNARVEKSKKAVTGKAETKLFNMWVRIHMLRNSILETRSKVQKLKNEMKLYQIIVPQIFLLKEWGRLENKNSDAVGRLTRKLSAISVRLPFVQGAKGDLSSMYDAMNAALGTMDSIQAIVTLFLPQVEKTCFLVTELSLMQDEEEQWLDELHKWISTVALLQAKERSLRASLLQAS